METTIPSKPLRTLVVDNSATFLMCLRRFLAVQGIVEVVGTAASGREAVEKAGELIPDLVLMDLHMPGLDGLQATSLLREQAPNSRIIIMTANDTESLATYCRTQGAHGFVAKHEILSTLSEEIQRLFPAVPRA